MQNAIVTELYLLGELGGGMERMGFGGCEKAVEPSGKGGALTTGDREVEPGDHLRKALVCLIAPDPWPPIPDPCCG
jgi:hypothetical protein